MAASPTPSPVLPTPDANAGRPVPPVNGQPTWVVPCPDLDVATGRFEAAGFVVLAIGPADHPRWTLMSTGHERFPTLLRLDTSAHRAGHRHPFLEVDEDDPLLGPGDGGRSSEFVAAGPDAAATSMTVDPPAPTEPGTGATAEWVVGRAGMRYRDLLPGRWGGQFIASHIHIPDGGPVPDSVHYHHIEFQLIFCHRGWVRVVYQDQGEPIVLNPGDAILQAPGIRHRVLEASDDLHVIEVSSPAEHPTYVEHDLDLPNGLDPARWYGGQRFVHHRTAEAPWSSPRTGMQAQSFALEPATNGRFSACVVELEAAGSSEVDFPLAGSVDFEFVTVLDGALAVADTSNGNHAIVAAGAAFSLDDSVSWTARPVEQTRLLLVSRHPIRVPGGSRTADPVDVSVRPTGTVPSM